MCLCITSKSCNFVASYLGFGLLLLPATVGVLQQLAASNPDTGLP